MFLNFFLRVCTAFLLLVLPAISMAAVNTSLSVDVSGSMSGRKIEEAKKAASVYVDFVKKGDFISINSFSNDATVIVPARVIMSDNDRFAIKGLIDKLQPTGSTNIGAGIREGLKELKKSADKVIKI